MIKREVLEQVIAMFPVASDDATRYSIGGVRILSDETGITLTATDGHMMYDRTFPVGLNAPKGCWMIRDKSRITMLKNTLKQNKQAEDFPWSVTSEGDLFVSGNVFEKEDAKNYPPYKTVFPKAYQIPVGIALNAEYVLALAKALQSGEKHSPNVRIIFDAANPLAAITIEYSDREATAIVMPVRDDKVKNLSSELKERMAKEGAA